MIAGSSHIPEPFHAAERRRRRNWIVAFSLPGYVALATFALAARVPLDPPDPLIPVVVLFGVISVGSWALAPFFFLVDLVMLLRDPWRRERFRPQRVRLTLLVLGSPVAWFLSNTVADKYHLLR